MDTGSVGSDAKITMDGGEKIGKLAMELAAKGANLDSLTPAVAEILVAAIGDVFEAEGPGWQALTPGTIASRRNVGATKILQDTGLLVGSVSASHSGTTAEAGSNVPYGLFHVLGTSQMVARDWLEIDQDKTTDDVAELLLGELLK